MSPTEVDALPVDVAVRLAAVTGAVDEGRRRREKANADKQAKAKRPAR